MKKTPSPIKLFLDSLFQNPQIAAQIASHKVFPACSAQYASPKLPWSQALNSILLKRGVQLYSHQAMATDYVRSGQSIVISTPTASGKSLVYNLPVLEKSLADPDATALYLFPLKALAQDQLSAFNSLCADWPADARPVAALYDGDTPEAERRRIRQSPPGVLLTNPEMLHLAILPWHTKWTTFLAGLSHVIIDEAHTYRGIFGAHMAQVFRRLKRIAARYGAHPQFIFSTATLGNPLELASALMGESRPPQAITESGAPQGERHYILANPDLAPATFAMELLKRGLAQDLRIIVYCRSRRMTELLSIWTAQEEEALGKVISSYRAGYLPEERREIEKRMASGELKAVISTSALELGIDIGGLDLCILVGYPGSIMQTLQRGGRVGRARQESAVVLVCGDDALDQFFANNPEEFFSRKPEKAVINPENEIILETHLVCAASESPLHDDEPLMQNPAVRKALLSLEKKGLVLPAANGREWLAAEKSPQRKVDLRGCGSNYLLEDEQGRVIGSLEGFRAWREAHPGAVYLHQGKNYVVQSLDDCKKRVIVKQQKVDWFTRSRGNKNTDILAAEQRKSFGNCAAFFGRLRVSEFITGYEKRSTQGQRLLSITPLDAPPYIFVTEGFWLIIPDSVRKSLEDNYIHFMGSIHAVEHAAIGLLPLEVLADRNDFGGISIPLHHQLGLPAIFVYDAIPGGAGLCRSAFENIPAFLRTVFNGIANCQCEDGCPSCIQSPKCGSGNRPLNKKGSIFLLDNLLKPGPDGEDICKNLRISPAPDRMLANKTERTDKMPQNLLAQEPILQEQVQPNPTRLIPDSFSLDIQPTFENIATPVSNVSNITPPARYVVFDVETRKSASEVGGWKNASDMGVSIACLYDNASGNFYAYEQENLEEMFKIMRDADLVVGFNSFRFDYAVLSPFAEKSALGNFCLRSLPAIDLLQRITLATGSRISLDNIAQATLNLPKSGDGLQALRWWKEGKLDEISRYCQQDVRLTRDIYLFGLKNGHIFYTNKAGAKVRVQIDFTPK